MPLHPDGNFSTLAVLWKTSDPANLFSYFCISFAATTRHPGLPRHHLLAGLSFTSWQRSTEGNCFWKMSAKITSIFLPYSLLQLAFSLPKSKPSSCSTGRTEEAFQFTLSVILVVLSKVGSAKSKNIWL